MSTYTVQRRVVDTGTQTWVDIANVRAPARSRRRTVIAKALDTAGLHPRETEDMTVRVLDEASAREVPVTTKNRDPEWEIG